MRLSICIPTYNRGHTLHTLLASLTEQITLSGLFNEVEVVVSDNASGDDTAAVFAGFADKGFKTTYFRQTKNLGFGRNLNKAISLATGDYCWLMGSDDIPAVGALVKVLQLLNEAPDVVIGNVSTNGKLRSLISSRVETQQLHDAASMEAFLLSCTEISSLFAFMSSLIVRRAYWESVAMPDELATHPYTHQLRLFMAMVEHGLRLRTLHDTIVVTGAEGNEWDAVISKHFELDCRTLTLINETILPANIDRAALGAVFKRQYGPTKLLCARAGMSADQWNRIAPTLESWGYDPAILKKRFYDGALFWLYKRAKQLKGLSKQ